MQDSDWRAWLRLLLTPKLGRSSIRQLLAALGTPGDVLSASASRLAELVGKERAQGIASVPDGWVPQLQRTEDWLAQSDPSQARRMIVALGDELYPQPLLDIDDPPLLLYMQLGSQWSGLPAEALQQAWCGRALAMVGSRNPTPQGEINAHAFAAALAAGGWTIVSGLALGIDGAAHRGALSCKNTPASHLSTIAVVGTGLDRVYPRQHHELVRDIARHGAVFSEYHIGQKPLPAHFPQRNRIIAGLALGTLVVEAALESGSLITAKLSAEQGKDVFAMPGSIHSTQSRGCHALIKQGAKLVETVEDILEEYPLIAAPAARQAGEAQAGSDEGGHGLLLQAMGWEPVSLDELQGRTGWPTPGLLGALLELELSSRVVRLPGGLFQRMVRV